MASKKDLDQLFAVYNDAEIRTKINAIIDEIRMVDYSIAQCRQDRKEKLEYIKSQYKLSPSMVNKIVAFKSQPDSLDATLTETELLIDFAKSSDND